MLHRFGLLYILMYITCKFCQTRIKRNEMKMIYSIIIFFSLSSSLALSGFWRQVDIGAFKKLTLWCFQVTISTDFEIRIDFSHLIKHRYDYQLLFLQAMLTLSSRLSFDLEKKRHNLKACVRYLLSNFYFSPNDNPSETMNNVFYLI